MANNKRYFIASSLEHPHIYLMFMGVLTNINRRNKGIIEYSFSGVDVIENENTISKYLSNCTYNIFGNKTRKIDLEYLDVLDINKTFRQIFKERYYDKEIIVYMQNVYNDYDSVLEACKTANNRLIIKIDDMKKDLLQRKIDFDTTHNYT